MENSNSRPAFDPTTWVVYEDFTEEDFNKASSQTDGEAPPGQLGVLYERSRIKVPSYIRDRDARILRTREHEWTHYRQHISTPLGLFCFRLCAMREHATLQYLQHHAPKMASVRPTFSELWGDRSTLSDEAAAWITLWTFADKLEGILWCKTCPLEALQLVWNVVCGTMTIDVLTGEMRSSKCKLITRRPLTDSAVPDGHITIRDLSEGFALYRELQELTFRYGVRDALTLLGSAYESDNGIAARYIETNLGISRQHPLSGALQEAALLCFVDPFLCDGCDVLDWDAIHPGMCFERAVEALASLRSLPADPRNAYALAFDVLGLTQSPHWHSTLARVANVSSSPEAILPLDLTKDELPSDPVEILALYHQSLFRTGLRLRHDCPDIYFFPQLYFPPNWNRFVEGTRPPLIVHSRGVSLPRATSSRGALIGFQMLMHAFDAACLDDIARHGQLRSAKRFRRSVRKTFPHMFQSTHMKQHLQAMFARAYNSTIAQLEA